MKRIFELSENDYKALKEEGVQNHIALADTIITRSILLYEEVSDLDALTEELLKDPEFRKEYEKLLGRWIFHKDFNESCRYGCNQCGNLTNIPSNFCPNCGAKMRKGDAE